MAPNATVDSVHGSVCFQSGVLYVGRHAITAHVRPYDVDGRALGPGFSFRGADGGRATVSGLAVDRDHRFWVADGAASAVRGFTQFGRELAGIASLMPADADAPDHFGRVVDVAVGGVEDEERLLVASTGPRRHALQMYSREGEAILSLRPMGNPLGQFLGLTGVALLGRMSYACEGVARRVQVFRNGDFHFAFGVESGFACQGQSAPCAVAPLANGRLVIAHGDESNGGLTLVDGSGRRVRTLAEHGTETGQVFAPTDVTVDEAASDRDTRVAVIDRDAERVQIFTLDGRCYGAIVELPEPIWSASARVSAAPERRC